MYPTKILFLTFILLMMEDTHKEIKPKIAFLLINQLI